MSSFLLTIHDERKGAALLEVLRSLDVLDVAPASAHDLEQEWVALNFRVTGLSRCPASAHDLEQEWVEGASPALPQLLAAEALDACRVRLAYADGVAGILDLSPFIY